MGASGDETASIQILLVGHLEDQLTQAALNTWTHLNEPACLLKVANLATGRVVIVVILASIGRQMMVLLCIMLLMVMKYLLVECGRPWEPHHHFVLGGCLLVGDQHIVIVHRCGLRQIQS